MYVENEPAMNKNEVVLNNLPGELYITEANEKIQENCITIGVSSNYADIKTGKHRRRSKVH